ncbi:MAG: 6,7-dimethyl-8-ribityllumazine synthase [Candidatus Nanosalina sp. J07AB43]|jgi:6,7-dimethyl-8-ribityllumazine synthase (EC 2.5.1.9)|nr:MAG: 6,7-dimethyl-8-ribityllumazine synthase [Candidatus Nanosalina sp. J07AB43]
MKIGVVRAKYNEGITEKMLESALSKAEDLDVEAQTLEVPGAYDTPLAADRLARKSDIDAVAVIGAVIKGDTDHDEVIGHAAATKLSEISLERDIPVTMGVTGPGMTAPEAKDRVDYAAQAVESAVEMIENLSDAGQ